jgi:hypothetical protein
VGHEFPAEDNTNVDSANGGAFIVILIAHLAASHWVRFAYVGGIRGTIFSSCLTSIRGSVSTVGAGRRSDHRGVRSNVTAPRHPLACTDPAMPLVAMQARLQAPQWAGSERVSV